MCAGLLRVGVDAVRDFQAIDVGVVFKLAAESTAERRGKEAQDAENEKNHGQGRPVAQFANLPALAESAQEPAGEAIEQVVPYQQSNRAYGQTDDHVIEDVVPHLVAEHEKSFRSGGLLDRGVPHHHALRWPEAGNVSVKSRNLLAGLHQEHAFAGDVETAPPRDLLNRLDQLGVVLVQRLELVEQGIDDNRTYHDDEPKNRQRDQPEVKPPALWAPADDQDHEPEKNRPQDQADHLALRLVPKP